MGDGDGFCLFSRWFNTDQHIRRGGRIAGDERKIVQQNIIAAEGRTVDVQLRNSLPVRRLERNKRISNSSPCAELDQNAIASLRFQIQP